MRPRAKRSRSTQKDIAEALNVSRACVAIGLNPLTRHKLLPETVAMIEAKAKELNYRPQRVARMLRSGRSHTIGVVFVSGVYHAPQERVRHLARSAIRAGYQLVSVDMEWFDGNIAAAQNYLLDMAVEGIIFCNLTSGDSKEWESFLEECSLPAVSMYSTVDTANQAQIDMSVAYHEMTQHHITQGSRSLHLLLPFHDLAPDEQLRASSVKERVSGFVRAIHAEGGEVIASPEVGRVFGLPVRFSFGEDRVRGHVHYPLRTEIYKNVFDVGYHETHRILKNEKVDSLVCSNDDIAIGALSACNEQGLHVPQDIKVSGADDAPFARYGQIPLSTISQPPQEMARWSIERIVELIELPEERDISKSKTFPCELIFRKSTMPSLLTTESHKKSSFAEIN